MTITTKTSGIFLMPKCQELRTAIEKAAETSTLSDESRKVLTAFLGTFTPEDLTISHLVHSDKWEEIAEELGVDEEIADEAAYFIDTMPNVLKPFADVSSIPARDPKEVEEKRKVLADRFCVPLDHVSYFGREERKNEREILGLKPTMCDYTGDFFSVHKEEDDGFYVDAESLTRLRYWGCL